MSERFWWFLIGAVVIVVVALAAWFFWPRPIRSAAPMPASPQEKAQRWKEAMQKAQKGLPQPTGPKTPTPSGR